MHREALFDWSHPLPPAVEDSASCHILQAQSHPRFCSCRQIGHCPDAAETVAVFQAASISLYRLRTPGWAQMLPAPCSSLSLHSQRQPFSGLPRWLLTALHGRGTLLPQPRMLPGRPSRLQRQSR